MKKRVIFGILAVASITAAAYAAPIATTGTRSAKMDANGDGNVSKTEALAHADARFAMMDADGNGQIDARDRQARAKLRFAAMDADKNGTVNEAEFVTAANAKAAARSARNAANAESPDARRSAYKGGSRNGNRNTNTIGSWGKGDVNNDKAISRDEYDAATQSRFAVRDKDGNGALSADEMQSARKGMRARMPQSDKMDAG
jgi:Ca2+-binding EF-hand superfamily protein